MDSWRWAACGKHPVAKDFFRIGESLPILKGFSDWVENGYAKGGAKTGVDRVPCSWRFWARGAGKENLVCGVLRSSSDLLGRPYPLLILGTGILNDWEDRWDLLPVSCEQTWSQMESISIRGFKELKYLQHEIGIIRPPRPFWTESPELTDEVNGPPPEEEGRTAEHAAAFEKEVMALINRSDIFVPIDPLGDGLGLIQLCHRILKMHVSELLTAVFMGGTAVHTYVAFFRRALAVKDFLRIWSVCSGEGIEMR